MFRTSLINHIDIPGLSQLRLCLIVSPALEKSLSAGTKVATVPRYLFATLLSSGNVLSFVFRLRVNSLGSRFLPYIFAFQYMHLCLLCNCPEKPHPNCQTPAIVPWMLNTLSLLSVFAAGDPCVSDKVILMESVDAVVEVPRLVACLSLHLSNDLWFDCFHICRITEDNVFEPNVKKRCWLQDCGSQCFESVVRTVLQAVKWERYSSAQQMGSLLVEEERPEVWLWKWLHTALLKPP